MEDELHAAVAEALSKKEKSWYLTVIDKLIYRCNKHYVEK